jgi:peroxiredoxin
MEPKPLSKAFEEAFVRCRDMDASLAERLRAFANTVTQLSPTFQNAVDRLVGRLKEHEVGQSAPQPGEPMPSFLLPDETGRLVSLEELLARGPLAIAFHRGHWCPYCRINTAALAKAQEEIVTDGGQIVAIMPDRQQFAADFKREAGARFPILLDMDSGYTLTLNLAFWVDEDMSKLIAAAGYDIPNYQGNPTWILPIPATFVVGSDGRIEARFIDPDYRKRVEVEELIAALKSAH